MKRRTLIQTAGGAAMGLLGAGLPLVGHTQDRYAKYKGQTVVMNIPAHPHYDAMLGKLIAHGPTRASQGQAAARDGQAFGRL